MMMLIDVEMGKSLENKKLKSLNSTRSLILQSQYRQSKNKKTYII